MARTNHPVNEQTQNAEMGELALIRNASELLMRSRFASLLGQSFGGARDLYLTLGYNKQLTFPDYWNMFRRGRLGKRVVSAPVESTWRGSNKSTVRVMEDDSAEDTAFEKDWKALDKKFKIIPKLVRLDKLCRLGEFAILLLGFNDGAKLEEPLVAGGVTGKRQLIYVQPYHQGSVQIVEWEADVTNPRYGLPKFYNVGINRTGLYSSTSSNETVRVHYSRVIHVAEGLLDNDVLGIPSLESPFNTLSDIEKIAGGNAEMYWQGALGGKVFSAKEGATLDATSLKDMQKEIDEYTNGMRRYLRLQNMDVHDMTPGISDPKAAMEVQMNILSGDTGIPQRILLGSERGELASSQDESNWLSRVQDRREQFAEPMIMRPFVDKLIEVGAISPPKKCTVKDGVVDAEYKIEWPDLYTQGEKERADIANTKSAALKNYCTAPGAEQIMPPDLFLEWFMGLTTEQIEAVKKFLKENPPEEPLDPAEMAAVQASLQGNPIQTPGAAPKAPAAAPTRTTRRN